MPQQPHISGTPFTPLLALTVELEQLGPHLEGLLFAFLVGGRLDFLGQVHDGLEVRVLALLDLFSVLLVGVSRGALVGNGIEAKTVSQVQLEAKSINSQPLEALDSEMARLRRRDASE